MSANRHPNANQYSARLRAATDAAVLAELARLDYGRHELARALKMSPNTVRNSLARLRTEGKIRIADYERTARGWHRIYGIGSEPDAKEPKPQTRAQLYRNYATKHLGRIRAKRSTKAPMQIFYNQLIARTA